MFILKNCFNVKCKNPTFVYLSWALLFFCVSWKKSCMCVCTWTSQSILYSLLETGYIISVFTSPFMSHWMKLYISPVCQTPFTVTGFIKPSINYSGKVNEWLRMKRTCVSLTTSFSLLAVNNSNSVMIQLYHYLFVSPSLVGNNARMYTKMMREQFVL